MVSHWCDPRNNQNRSSSIPGPRVSGAPGGFRSRTVDLSAYSGLALSLEPRRRVQGRRFCKCSQDTAGGHVIKEIVQVFRTSFRFLPVVPMRTTSQTRDPLRSTHPHHPRRPATLTCDLGFKNIFSFSPRPGRVLTPEKIVMQGELKSTGVKLS